MNAADKLATLRALRHGLDAAIANAEADVEQVRALTGAKSFTTPLGSVTVTRRGPSVKVDEDRLLRWCRDHAPTEVVESVRPAFVAAFKKRLTVVGDQAVDEDGVVCEFAAVTDGLEYITVKLDPDVKDDAAEQVAARVETLAAFLELGAS